MSTHDDACAGATGQGCIHFYRETVNCEFGEIHIPSMLIEYQRARSAGHVDVKDNRVPVRG